MAHFFLFCLLGVLWCWCQWSLKADIHVWLEVDELFDQSSLQQVKYMFSWIEIRWLTSPMKNIQRFGLKNSLFSLAAHLKWLCWIKLKIRTFNSELVFDFKQSSEVHLKQQKIVLRSILYVAKRGSVAHAAQTHATVEYIPFLFSVSVMRSVKTHLFFIILFLGV